MKKNRSLELNIPVKNVKKPVKIVFLICIYKNYTKLLVVMEAGVLFSPKPSKSKVFCSVFGCNSKASKNPELGFYRFPEAGKIKVKRVIKPALSEMILRMGKEVMSNMRICSLHVIKEDYTRFTQPSK